MLAKALTPAGITGLVIYASAVLCELPGFAQSTDFSRPTPITSVPLVREHDGSKNISYYYTFEAGPGDILVTFDGHATKYSTSAQLKLSDANRNALGDLYLVANTSPSSVTKRFQFTKRQPVVIEIALHEDTSMGVMQHSVNITGAVQLAHTAPPPVVASSSNVGSPVGQQASKSNLKLNIQMRDGTTRTFDMDDIRRFAVE